MTYFLPIVLSVLVASTEACSGLYARDAVPEWGYNPEDGAMMWYNMDPVKNKLVGSMEDVPSQTFEC